MEKIEEKTTQELRELKESLEKQLQPLMYERIWTRSWINDLPDAAFALIQSGGTKEDGKTVPRSLRRLPHHRADGSIDLPHLRNSLARAPQMKDVSEEERNRAIAHLQAHAKAAGIGEFAKETREPLKHAWREQEEPVEFQVAPEPTTDELIESIEDIVEQINAKIDALETQIKKPEPTVEESKKQVDALHNQLTLITEQKKTLEDTLKESEAKIKALKEKLSKKSLGEAVVTPIDASTIPVDMISKKEILALLPERVPTIWGYGPYEMVQKIKRKLES